ncbi:MAG: hypothetical protein K0Q67_3095 [Cellvibrio sp.]|jgi:hypothetical protein|nr:hypothetical protein [Cellvibrio sp.]
MNAFSFKVYLLLLLLLPLPLVAQTLPEGARANWDRCLGYEMDYKKYPKPVIAKVQADMYQLYHLEPAWKNDAARNGKPLNDGILGPITWFWMQRFCKSVALDSGGNAVAAFPQRATEIATFSKNFSDDARTLLSDPFKEWVATHRSPCDLNAREILAQGSDSELQALLRCYRPASVAELAPAPKPVPAVKAKEPPLPPYTLYVFRANDFTALESEVVDAPEVDTKIDNMLGKHYPDKTTAQAELTTLLADLPPKESKKIVDKLSAALRKKNRYEINDEVLNTLSQQGISDALFGELKNLLGKSFDDKMVFNDTLTIAINKSLPAKTPIPTPVPAISEEGDATTDAASANEQAARTTALAAKPNPAKLLLQIRIASQQSYYELDKAAAVAAMASNNEPITGILIKVLKPLQDIEYPTAKLIDLAIMNKILKALDVCKQDKSNTEDKQSDSLEPDEKILLAKAINEKWKPRINSDSTPILYCGDNHEEDLKVYYEKSWRKVLRKLYIKDMKKYEGINISWDGSSEKCGCVRTEIQTIAYGVYPYWKVKLDENKKSKKQIFDFSSFARVAYFGLTATDDGTLVQIKAGNRTPTILDSKEDDARQFIREARRYGSKVDWIIEKEFPEEPQYRDEDAVLNAFFYRLKRDVLKLLTTPLDGAESHLLPLLSFGLAAQPSNGDGVTFYFKNYPKTKIAKDAFGEFFKTLKNDLKEFDEKRDSFHAVKNHTYVNVMIDQSEFLDSASAFSRANLSILTINNYQEKESATNPEVQEQVKSMIILLLEDPYYNALDTIYAVTDGPIRSIIAPLMFTDYSGLNTAGKISDGTKLDEREKRLSYINESFGGGGFWPMIEYKDSSDGKNYDGFNRYIGEKFSPGYVEGSLWNEQLCHYRWRLIGIMNFWLLLSLTYVASIFYLYPHRCKELPAYIAWLQHPLTVVVVLLPLIVLWVYLFVVFPPLRSLNLTNLVGLIVLILVIVAGVDAIKNLKKIKPNRSLLQPQKKMSVPRRMPETNKTSKNDEPDDVDGGDDFR